MKPRDQLLTVEELADYLGVPVATVYAWRYRRQGPPGFRGRQASTLSMERHRALDRRPHRANASQLSGRIATDGCSRQTRGGAPWRGLKR